MFMQKYHFIYNTKKDTAAIWNEQRKKRKKKLCNVRIGTTNKKWQSKVLPVKRYDKIIIPNKSFPRQGFFVELLFERHIFIIW